MHTLTSCSARSGSRSTGAARASPRRRRGVGVIQIRGFARLPAGVPSGFSRLWETSSTITTPVLHRINPCSWRQASASCEGPSRVIPGFGNSDASGCRSRRHTSLSEAATMASRPCSQNSRTRSIESGPGSKKPSPPWGPRSRARGYCMFSTIWPSTSNPRFNVGASFAGSPRLRLCSARRREIQQRKRVVEDSFSPCSRRASPRSRTLRRRWYGRYQRRPE